MIVAKLEDQICAQCGLKLKNNLSMLGLLATEYGDFKRLSVSKVKRGNIAKNQLRIKVFSAGVSLSVKLMVAGKYQRRPPLPFVPGTECAGVVLECGSNVTHFKAGDRVFAAIDWGAYAEEAIAYEVNTYQLSDALTFQQAINFNSYATAIAALTWPRLLRIQPGENLLIHGAAGALGLAAVQIGKVMGARVIATASTKIKCDAVRRNGADHVVQNSEKGFREIVLDLTNGEGANAVLDPVGGHVFEESLRCVALGGRICPIGFTSGKIPIAPTNIILVKNISVVGLNFGTYYGWSPHDIRFQSEELVRSIMDKFSTLSDEGKITPKVHAEFSIHKFRAAMEMVTARQSIGRVVFTLSTSIKPQNSLHSPQSKGS